MKKKSLFGKCEFLCFFIAIAEFILFLLWGLNMQPGDEMAYGLITIYAFIPLTSLILCSILAKNNLKAAVALTVIMALIEIFLPYIIYGTFEIAFSLALSLIPCVVGLGIGYLLNKRK